MDYSTTTPQQSTPTGALSSHAPEGGAACLCDISEPPLRFVPGIAYRRSVRLDWSKFFSAGREGGRGGVRGKVESMSEKSLKRLTVALGDAPRDWGVMATLTFREVVIDGREPLRRFQRLMRGLGYGDLHHAWVREYQRRGAVHYHYLFEREGLAEMGLLDDSVMRPIQRKNAVRKLVGGKFERDLVHAWEKAVGDESKEFRDFQRGGIIELLEEGNSASRYFGSYLAKPEQKTLPKGAEKCGRWWWICPAAKPVPEGAVECHGYPFSRPLAHVFDKSQLSLQPLPEKPETLAPGSTYREQFDSIRTTEP